MGEKELNMAWIDRPDVVTDHADLPPEAFARVEPGAPVEIENSWIAAAEHQSKLKAMRVWFHDRYVHPDDHTPWEEGLSEYIFVHGGPYDGERMVRDRFSAVVPEEILRIIADELYEEENLDWAPDPRLWNQAKVYDPRFSVAMDLSQTPLDRLRERLDELRLTGAMTGDLRAKVVVDNMAYSGAVGALEAFLWETVDQQVTFDDQVLRSVVTKIPVFSNRPLRLGDLFERMDKLRDEVKAHLQNIVWHRWDVVVPLLKAGLGLEVPSLKTLVPAVFKRHDIVHRSGYDLQGKPVSVERRDFEMLRTEVLTFAQSIQSQLENRLRRTPPSST